MEIELSGLSPFEPILRKLPDIAHRSGVDAVEKKGRSMDDIRTDQRLMRDFVRGCHYGYDLAQRQIAKHVIAMEADISRLSSELAQLRRERNPDAKTTLWKIKVLRQRQLILRRLIDSILSVLVGHANWLFRRFTVDMKIRNIDPVILGRTLEIAVSRNRADRLKLNLVCDLSTVLQIGDLFEIDLTASKNRKWSVIELKSGAVNEVLSGLIEQVNSLPQADTVSKIRDSMGDHAAKQAGRMMRQAGRLRELDRVVDTDRGLDPATGAETLMTKDTIVLDNYAHKIREVYEKAKRDGAAALTVGGCLRIAGFTREKTGDHASSCAAHQFFHMANPSRKCAVLESGNPSERDEEERLVAIVPYYVDIVDYSLHVPMADSIFFWGDGDMTVDLVLGRVRIFVQFDYEAFFKSAEAKGISLSWITGKNIKKVQKYSMCLPGTNYWGVVATLEDGRRMTLLAGFLGRVYANLVTPSQLFRMIRDFPKSIADTFDAEFVSPV